MIDTKTVKDASGEVDLCETFSTEGFKLRQVETGIIYGSSVIDVIKGLNGDKPFGSFSYEETDEVDESEEETESEEKENEDL